MKNAAAMVLLVLATGCDEKPDKPEPAAKAEPPAETEPQQAPAKAPNPEPQTPEDKAFVESMQTLCRIADEVKADPAVASKDRPSETVTRFHATKPPADVLKVLGTMAGVPPEARPEKMAAEMAKRGHPGWSCPTLSEVVN